MFSINVMVSKHTIASASYEALLSLREAVCVKSFLYFPCILLPSEDRCGRRTLHDGVVSLLLKELTQIWKCISSPTGAERQNNAQKRNEDDEHSKLQGELKN